MTVIPQKERQTLAHACHALMCGSREKMRGVSVEAEDTGEPNGEARVMQKLMGKHKFKSKNFDPRIEPKIAIDTMEEGHVR